MIKNFKILVSSLSRLIAFLLLLVAALFVVLIYFNSKPEILGSKIKDPKNWKPKDVSDAMVVDYMPHDVKQGYLLVSETSKYMGPHAKDPEMRFAGNNLACANCHLKVGTQAGSGSWVGVTKRFPSFSGRANKETTIEDRVNGCMERSMDGKKLPKDSKPMKEIVAYMNWLGEDLPKQKESEYKGYPKIELPERAVDLENGYKLFTEKCIVCHGEHGEGIKLQDSTKGYQYPPLWGDDSFNTGAGMHRVITSAEFIKSNMPFGEATWDKPVLTDEEAYDLAGYINSFNRPDKSNLQKDYPDTKLKPVSTPYGPYADNFSQNQHQFGPFQPIIKFYKDKFDIKKSK